MINSKELWPTVLHYNSLDVENMTDEQVKAKALMLVYMFMGKRAIEVLGYTMPENAPK